MPDHFDATRQPVGLVDSEPAEPNPRKTGVLSSDYPQDKQRKETGGCGKRPFRQLLPRRHPQHGRPEPRVVWGFQARKRARRLSEPFNLVEPAGIEPASASPLQAALHT